MLQDYQVLQFKKGDFQDQNGNFWCDMALQGVSEPVRIAVKDPTQFHDNMTLYGAIETKTSKAGKDYLKFRRERKEDAQQATFQGSASPKKEWQPKDDNAIARAVALKAAVELTASDTRLMKDKVTVLEIADRFLEWLQGSSESTNPKVNQNLTTATLREDSQASNGKTEPSGYDKFKSSKPTVNQTDEQAHEAEFASLLSTSLDQGTEFNLDDVPY